MAKRILPSPDVFTTSPSDGKILEYYAGVFEAVYVLLHPFIKPLSIEKEVFNPSTYPTRTVIVKNCAAISWDEVAKKGGLPSIAAVDIALRTMIHGLRTEFLNQEYADKIQLLYELEGILPPPEGSFSDLLYSRVLTSIQDAGHDWVWVGDEFGTKRKLYWLEDLKGQDSGPEAGHPNVFTPDKTILWATHWDSHFSFLCSSKRTLANIVLDCHFEGFFCKPSTEIYWSVRN